MRIPSGVTDQYIYFVAVDATDFVTRETGLSSFTVYRSRNGGTAAAFTTPTINETDSTNMPGVYELLLDEDMTIDSGDDSQEMVFHITHSGMAPVTRTIELYRPKITAGNTLDVTVTGAGGIDWGNVENAGTTVDLSATSINLCDTVTTNTDMRGTDSALLASSAPTNFSDLSITATTGRVDVAAIAGTAQTANDNGADINAILLDTDELQTNQGNWVTATGFSTHSAADVWSVATRVLTANTNLNDPTAAAIADAVLDEALSGHSTAGSLGKAITDIEADVDAVLVDTGTILPATLSGLNDVSVSDIWTTQLTESYAADGSAPTGTQALMLIQQALTEFAYSGTSFTVKKLDGSTTAAVMTLDDGTNPTSSTRSS